MDINSMLPPVPPYGWERLADDVLAVPPEGPLARAGFRCWNGIAVIAFMSESYVHAIIEVENGSMPLPDSICEEVLYTFFGRRSCFFVCATPPGHVRDVPPSARFFRLYKQDWRDIVYSRSGTSGTEDLNFFVIGDNL